MSIYCSLVVTCWERADSFAILCVTFFLCFVTFQYGVLGQVWYLIVSIPDLCLLSYFHRNLGFYILKHVVSLPLMSLLHVNLHFMQEPAFLQIHF